MYDRFCCLVSSQHHTPLTPCHDLVQRIASFVFVVIDVATFDICVDAVVVVVLFLVLLGHCWLLIVDCWLLIIDYWLLNCWLLIGVVLSHDEWSATRVVLYHNWLKESFKISTSLSLFSLSHLPVAIISASSLSTTHNQNHNNYLLCPILILILILILIHVNDHVNDNTHVGSFFSQP